jgi:hypothetical protein
MCASNCADGQRPNTAWCKVSHKGKSHLYSHRCTRMQAVPLERGARDASVNTHVNKVAAAHAVNEHTMGDVFHAEERKAALYWGSY